MIKIRIPSFLRNYTDGQAQVAVNGHTIAAALEQLTTQHPDLRQHLFDESDLRELVNLYLNQEDVRHLQGLQTAVNVGDHLIIVPAIAGG